MDGFEDAAQPQCPHCGTVLADDAIGYRCWECELTFLPSQQLQSELAVPKATAVTLDLSEVRHYVALSLSLEGYAANLETMAEEEEAASKANGRQGADAQVEAWRDGARAARELFEQVEQQLGLDGGSDS